MVGVAVAHVTLLEGEAVISLDWLLVRVGASVWVASVNRVVEILSVAVRASVLVGRVSWERDTLSVNVSGLVTVAVAERVAEGPCVAVAAAVNVSQRDAVRVLCTLSLAEGPSVRAVGVGVRDADAVFSIVLCD